LQYHNEKAFKLDGLSGLTDEMIMWNARDAYRILRRGSRALYRLLNDLDVKLDSKGELDLSNVENPSLQHALKNNPAAKLVLASQGEFSEKYIEEEEEEEEPVSTDGPEPLGKPILWDSPNPYNRNYSSVDPSNFETKEQRMTRLRRLWEQTKKQKRDPPEQLELQQKAVEKLRMVRKKIDQRLIQIGKEPVSEYHKTEYTQEEFLSDKDFDIGRMTKYLSLSKEEVVETLTDKYEYEEINRITTPKIIVENTVPIGYDRYYSSYDQKMEYNNESSENEDQEDIKEVVMVDYEEEEPEREGDEQGWDAKRLNKLKKRKSRLQDAILDLSKK